VGLLHGLSHCPVMMGSDGSAAIVHLEEAVGIREDQVRVGGGAGEGRGGRRFA
jgi:hypothetical protein